MSLEHIIKESGRVHPDRVTIVRPADEKGAGPIIHWMSREQRAP